MVVTSLHFYSMIINIISRTFINLPPKIPLLPLELIDPVEFQFDSFSIPIMIPLNSK